MNPSPFELRGVIEGFYGVFYTVPERNDLIRFIGQHGYNLYIYAPKNDRQHRARWREPYPAEVMDQFAETIAIARAAGVAFCYALSVGVSMIYASEQDFATITDKFRAFYDRGVRSFSILFDDIACAFQHEQDRQRYRSYAEAHVDVCNRLYAWLRALDPACTLSMCPTNYHGRAPFGEYIHELGAGLAPGIDIFYTGPEVCSRTIGVDDARGFAEAAGRAPLIWDNYPVNDLDMRGELHIGPIRNRDAALHQAARGIVVNPMTQAEASKIPLLAYADYLADPHGYDPARSWERALLEVGGAASFDSLKRFAETSLYCCLGTPEAPMLERLTSPAINALGLGEWPSSSPALQALARYIDDLDEDCYVLRYRMGNLRLRENLLPWIEALDDWVWMARRALLALEGLERGEQYEQPLRLMQRSVEEIRRHGKRIAGEGLLALARCVEEQAERRRGQAAEPHHERDRVAALEQPLTAMG